MEITDQKVNSYSEVDATRSLEYASWGGCSCSCSCCCSCCCCASVEECNLDTNGDKD